MKKIAADINYRMFKASAKYKGKKVSLNRPFRTPKGPKKFSVYVKNKKGNIIKVNFGDPDMEIKRDDPDRRKSFRARHECDKKKDKTKPGYWSCKMWGNSSVKSIIEKKSNQEAKMKKIAADINYRMFIKKAEEMKGYKLVSSEHYEQDHILGYYKTKESAVRGGYRWVVMENKREVEELELGNYDGTPYTLSQKKMYYDPWKISKINIEEGIFDASNSMRDVYVVEYSYSTDITDPGDIDLSENDEYVNYFNVDTTPEDGEEFSRQEGMGRRRI